MVAPGSSHTDLQQAPCRRHWEDWAGVALPGGGNHAVEKEMGKGGSSGHCWLFTFEKICKTHKKVFPISFSNSVLNKEEKVQ